jgi:hypothetical protein
MADYTLGDFRRLTNNMPDSTPIYKAEYCDERGAQWVSTGEPLVLPLKKDVLGSHHASDCTDLSSIISVGSDWVASIVI